MRPLLNRWRRWLWRQLFYRMVFGEQGRAGQALPHTRIAPSTCIEGEAGLELADHVFIGQFNFLDATAGLRIAEGVQITNFVSIVTHSSHRSIRLLGRTYASRQGEVPGYVRAPVEIGAYSFIGPHSVIGRAAASARAWWCAPTRACAARCQTLPSSPAHPPPSSATCARATPACWRSTPNWHPTTPPGREICP